MHHSDASNASSSSSAASGGSAPTHLGSVGLLGEVSPPIPTQFARWIVNVSAMEGRFSRKKMPNHPHTNCAKASLNMMTRTSAAGYAREAIFMNAVDTGWINEENPASRAAATAARSNFQTPLDEIDAAARILDPILAPLSEASKDGSGQWSCRNMYGAFVKDYFACDW